MIYASSRCGDFPELQDIRSVFASHFGREFVARAVELRNHCAVNLKVRIAWFSTLNLLHINDLIMVGNDRHRRVNIGQKFMFALCNFAVFFDHMYDFSIQ